MRIPLAAFLLAFALTPVNAAFTQTTPAASNMAAPAAPTQGNGAVGNTGAAAGGQAEQDFTIVNNTGHIVITLNVSPSREASWGPNILGGDKLGNGESAQITFARGETECIFDIKATYEDGDTTDERNVNLCKVATVTLTSS
jgi:hypothetical protein